MKAEDVIVGQEYMWTEGHQEIKEVVKVLEVFEDWARAECGDGTVCEVELTDLTIYLPPKPEIAGSETRGGVSEDNPLVDDMDYPLNGE